MCLIKRSICKSSAKGEGRQTGRRRRKGEGKGYVRAQVARRAPDAGVAVTSRRSKKAQKGEVVLNFICVVTLCHCPPSLSHCLACHAHSLAHHYLRVCVCKAQAEGSR